MNKITVNDITEFNINKTSSRVWYSYTFDTNEIRNLFESMIVATDSYSHDSITYYMNGFLFGVPALLSKVIKNRDMKFAILNMSHSDRRIRSVCKFMICCKGVYEIE